MHRTRPPGSKINRGQENPWHCGPAGYPCRDTIRSRQAQSVGGLIFPSAMKPFPFLAALLAVSACVQPALADRPLLEENFDRLGGFGELLLTDPNVQLIRKGGPDGSKAIRVSYVGSKVGSEGVVAGYPLRKAVMEATLAFDVRFGEDFQWVGGGKLHGLGPEHPVTGGNAREPDRWSARVMFGGDGRSKAYLYEQSPDKKYGVGGTSRTPVFKKGVWQKVVIRMKLNTPGKADGKFSVLVDGKEVNEQSGVEFRARDGKGTLISRMLFSTFHGGNSPGNAPKDAEGNFTTVHADFDNFRVMEGW